MKFEAREPVKPGDLAMIICPRHEIDLELQPLPTRIVEVGKECLPMNAFRPFGAPWFHLPGLGTFAVCKQSALMKISPDADQFTQETARNVLDNLERRKVKT